ncbi:hypothetical protein EXW96_26670 [Paenibacillus sp. JMULE4]|uniref:Rad52/Rad22 family DNA repair protein n=1 Tax=Paenibacillus sp. JMULE4 TaxID=2518342 RepID=UPI001575B76A|nr:Rad52/Rad22 family DNA repair protein [Paenibacillus sp. JMULE4]NTZ20975.1 hypothetical protein [Paenibacillus sp. JMULE4]
MSDHNQSLFERLNAPFPYSEYRYDSFGDHCYISGQAVTERINEVLGVGFWKYRGLYETEKIIHDPNGKNPRVKIYVEFSFFNQELKEWITFIDVGSEQIKPGMNEGDATKSAITDGMKKCSSRIGIASDLYKGLIIWDKQKQQVIVPDSYKAYYEKLGWEKGKETDEPKPTEKQTSNGNRKNDLAQKLKGKSTPIQNQIKTFWQELAGSLDGFDEWYKKKQEENVTDQQILKLLEKKLVEKKGAAIA